MKNKLSSQVPFLAIITIVAIIAIVIIVLSSKETLIVDEEGNIIGEGIAGLKTATSPFRSGPGAKLGTVNPVNPTIKTMPGEDSLLVSCGTGSKTVVVSGIGGSTTDPKAAGEESCCWKCRRYDNTGVCLEYYQICGQQC